MATLADVIRSKRKSGQSRTGSFFVSLKDKLKETIDPRQLFNQSGMLTALFPSLKAYKAKGVGEETGKLIQRRTAELSNSPQSMNGGMDLSAIEQNTKISAVNSMALPGLSRDINVMRQNISKLAKIAGVKPATKADNFFKKSSEREKEYESKFKTRPKLTGPNTTISDEEEKSKSFLGSLLSIIGGLIKAVTTTIGKIFSTLFTLLQGLVTSLFTTLKVVLTTVITSLFGLFKTSIGKLLKSLGKVFSLLGGGRLLGIIGGLLFSPKGLLLLGGFVAYNLIKQAFIKDKEKQELFLQLDDLVKSGDATPEIIARRDELAKAGFSREPRRMQMDLTKPSDFTTISSIKERLQKIPGDKDYLNDEESKKVYGVDRAALQTFLDLNEIVADKSVSLRAAELVSRIPDEDPSPFGSYGLSEEFQTEKTSPKPLTTAERNLDQTKANAENNTIKANATDLLQKQRDDYARRINLGTLDLGMLAEESGSYTNIQSMSLPSATDTSNREGGTKQSLPSTINPDRPKLHYGRSRD
jgi:hypothetical protein